jgi:predicted HTH transcriptional regulator
VTLAGLVALGPHPQQFYPQLNVTFVSYPTTDARPMGGGTRFLDFLVTQRHPGEAPEDIEIPGTNRTVCENRGSGIRTILSQLATYGLQPPRPRTSGGLFVADLRNTVTVETTAMTRQAPPTSASTDTGPSAAIMAAFATGPKPTADLMTVTELTRAGVGRHLRVLEAQGLNAPTENRQRRNVKWRLIQQNMTTSDQRALRVVVSPL